MFELRQDAATGKPAVQQHQQLEVGEIDLSTQSVEIIRHDESQIFDLETSTVVEPVSANETLKSAADISDKKQFSVETVTGMTTETFVSTDLCILKSLSSLPIVHHKVIRLRLLIYSRGIRTNTT